MNDDTPIDMSSLSAPDGAPDQVGPAFKRFRVRVVAFTLVCIAVVVVAVGSSVGLVVAHNTSQRELGELATYPPLSTMIAPINCATPTYDLGEVSATVLQVAPHMITNEEGDLARDGWVFELLIKASPNYTIPLSREVTTEDIGFRKSVSFAGVAPTRITTAQVIGLPGWDTVEAYITVPAASGNDLSFKVIGTDQSILGQIELDMKEITCNHPSSLGS